MSLSIPRPRVHVGPLAVPRLVEAVESSGAELSELADADALVYFGSDEPAELASMIHSGIRWVQLPHAGVEPWAREGLFEAGPVFTCSSGLYGHAVAEHAMAFILMASRRLHVRVGDTTWQESKSSSVLVGRTIAIVGGGGIAHALVRILQPFGVDIVVVSDRGISGFSSVPRARYREVLPQADFVVLAAPLTPATSGMIAAAEFAQMKPDAWLINVARGELVDTDALVAAIKSRSIGGAALDVTYPEPLPADSELWSLPNVVITSHEANPEQSYWELLAQRTRHNATAFVAAGADARAADLHGVIDSSRGY